jgi:hypothetical protein
MFSALNIWSRLKPVKKIYDLEGLSIHMRNQSPDTPARRKPWNMVVNIPHVPAPSGLTDR